MSYLRILAQRSFLACLLLILMETFSYAATISIEASSRGAYNQYGSLGTSGGSSNPQANYFSGELIDPHYAGGAPVEFRNFFSFNVGILSSGITITSATLRLDNWDPVNGILDPLDIGIYFTLFDVTTPIAQLNGNAGPKPNPAIFDDLGSGMVYGTSNIITTGDAGKTLYISLNSEAIGDLLHSINLSSYFSVGGYTDVAYNTTGSSAGLFGGSGNPYNGTPFQTSLILNVVPEPSTLLLLITGLIGFLVQGRSGRIW